MRRLLQIFLRFIETRRDEFEARRDPLGYARRVWAAQRAKEHSTKQ